MKNVTQPEVLVKHVTNRQFVQLATYARERNISREVVSFFLKDEKRLNNFFEDLKSINPWFEKLKAEAQKIGARVRLIKDLSVDYTKPHNDAAMAGGPETGSDCDVLKVGDFYQTENKIINEMIVLLSWPTNGGGSLRKAIGWGLSNGLLRTTPHVPFAIGEQMHGLNYHLKINPIYVVETTGTEQSNDHCLMACLMWYKNAERKAHFVSEINFNNENTYFAFRRPHLIL